MLATVSEPPWVGRTMPSQPNPGSKSDRDTLRHAMRAAGCTTAEVAIEMRVRFRMRPREAWRHAYGWTLQETAERISLATGETVAADASLVSKWEKWPGPSSRRPSLTALVAVAAAFECAIEDILDIEDRRALLQNDLRILQHHAPEQHPAEPPQRAVREPEPEPESDRVLAAAAESARWAQWAEVTNVGTSPSNRSSLTCRASPPDT